MQRRTLLAALGVALALGGCAGLDTVTVDVSTQTQWPAGRKPATYAIERLPSQQAHAEEQDRIEAAALPAIEGAGFVRAPLDEAEVLIQLGARVFEVASRDPYGSPFYWRSDWWFYGRYRPFFYGPGFYGPGYYGDSYDTQRETAILIRDRRSQQIVYETRASLTTRYAADGLLPLMFEASMKDFPTPALSPRSVTMRLPGR